MSDVRALVVGAFVALAAFPVPGQVNDDTRRITTTLAIRGNDGAPLPDDEGRIALVSLKDTRPGPRHVKWLQAVEVIRVAV
jgi:hypothetical protein